MDKKYDLGIIVGRFQVLHKGHAQVIEEGINSCKEFAIFVGSSQEGGTAKNPFDYEERKEMIQLAFPTAQIYPLPDIGVGNNCGWGDYVLAKVKEQFGRLPDVIFSGEEQRRLSWVDKSWGITEIFVPKSIDISATRMEEFILKGDKASFEEYIVPALNGQFDRFKAKIELTKDITRTDSI